MTPQERLAIQTLLLNWSIAIASKREAIAELRSQKETLETLECELRNVFEELKNADEESQ